MLDSARPRTVSSATLARSVAAALLLVTGILVVHTDAIRGMLQLWANSPMYSYAYLVPPISLYLLWSKRTVLAKLEPQPAWKLGTIALALWAVMLFAGRLAGIQVLQQLALIVAIVGAMLLVFGRRYARTSWAALAYLLLMVPIWDGFTEPLHEPFQDFSAALGGRMLQAVGVPVFREGTYLTLANVQLEVARACSGVNYLVAVLALGCPLAYVMLPGLWRRVALVSSAVLIAALSNALRVALIGILAYFEIGSPLHGPFHTLHGLFVSGIGYVVIFVGLWLLTPKDTASATRPPPVRARGVLGSVAPGAAFAAAAVFLIWGGLVSRYDPTPVPLAAALEEVPDRLGDWTATPLPPASPSVSWATADSRLQRRYRNHGGREADVLVAYFENQRQRKEAVDYQAGVLHRTASALSIGVPGQPALDVNVVRNREGALTLFWYEIDGTVESKPSAAKLRTMWNALTRYRTNGAVVMLTAPTDAAATPDERLRALSDLAVQMHLALARCLPGRSAQEIRARAALHPDRTRDHRVCHALCT
jgi:EpsI family protein